MTFLELSSPNNVPAKVLGIYALKPHLNLVIKVLSLGLWLPVPAVGHRELLKLSHLALTILGSTL